MGDTFDRSDKLLLAAVDTSPDAVAVVDRHGAVVASNAAWRRTTSAPSGNGSRRRPETNWSTFGETDLSLPGEIRETTLRGIRDVLEGANPSYTVEYTTTVHPADQLRLRVTRLVFDGQPWALIVREARSAQAGPGSKPATAGGAAAEGEPPTEREYVLRSILDTAVDAIITIDVKGIVRGFNRAASRMFGYSVEEVLGRNVSRLMPAPYSEEHDDYIERYLQTGDARIIGIGREVMARRKDGTLFPVDLAVSEVDYLGRFTGILRDLTSRRALEREVIECTTLEQQRIGQEIHDGLGQRLTGLSLLAKGLEQQLRSHAPQQADAARQMTEQLRLALDEAHRLARGLQPVDIDPHGLAAALNDLARDIEISSGLACRVEDQPRAIVDSRNVAAHLYRIAQEAVHNAVKHARANEIVIRLESRGSALILSVEDDGVGLTSGAARARGLGLHTMRYRAGIIGALLTLSTAPSGGALMQCVLPLTEDPTRDQE